ncbi:MAG: 4Fe-4S binding protein [Candidatus Thermoplasmatota archaeon]
MSDRIGIKIDRDLCKGCGICIKYCPNDVLAESDDLNQYDNHYPEVVSAERCIACRRCELYCPDFAIEVKEEEG